MEKRKEYVDYLFEDEETGEQFFVEVEKEDGCEDKAIETAMEYFTAPALLEMVPPEVAESWGLDTY